MHLLEGNEKTVAKAVETVLSRFARSCISISTGAVLLGGVLNLLRHGNEFVAWEKFYGEPAALCSFSRITDAAFAAQGKGIIQFGLILLVAVPVLRVAASMLAFIRKSDFVFIAFSLFVLLILSFSLFNPWG